MHYMGRIMRSPSVPMVTVDDLNNGGFQKWWSPVDRLLGTFETAHGNIHLVNTLPWDGSPNGRVDAILMETENGTKSRMSLRSVSEAVISASLSYERLS